MIYDDCDVVLLPLPRKRKYAPALINPTAAAPLSHAAGCCFICSPKARNCSAE